MKKEKELREKLYRLWDMGANEGYNDFAIDGYNKRREEYINEIIRFLELDKIKGMTEEVREALMRLTMCAREECSICKYENDCGYDKQVETATENMDTIINAFTERPKGEWVEEVNDEGEFIRSWHCSNCYYSTGFYTTMISDFCPKCGADMRGDKE